MVEVEGQYSHRLVFQSLAPEAGQDATGHWITPGAGSTTFEHRCRAEKAGNYDGGNIRKSADGQDFVFNWNVYAPLTCPQVPIGTAVSIYQDGTTVRATGMVKDFVREKYNVKFWL